MGNLFSFSLNNSDEEKEQISVDQMKLRLERMRLERQLQLYEELKAEEKELLSEIIEVEKENNLLVLLMNIDKYIRTRKKFDSAHPLKYKCNLSSIVNACEKCRLGLNISQTIHTFIENNPNHFKIDKQCNVSVKHNTLYQGKERVYGYFKCSKCNNKWSSGDSRANKWQQCKKCKHRVYPYSQTKLNSHNNE